MADEPRFRTLIEQPEYTLQLASIVARYSADVIEPVVRGLLWGIASNPKGYGKTTWNIYQARSRQFGLTVPALRLFFGFKDETEEEVVLL
jgi:hypothetical protein